MIGRLSVNRPLWDGAAADGNLAQRHAELSEPRSAFPHRLQEFRSKAKPPRRLVLHSGGRNHHARRPGNMSCASTARSTTRSPGSRSCATATWWRVCTPGGQRTRRPLRIVSFAGIGPLRASLGCEIDPGSGCLRRNDPLFGRAVSTIAPTGTGWIVSWLFAGDFTPGLCPISGPRQKLRATCSIG